MPNNYHPPFIALMKFLDSDDSYTQQTVFTGERLIEILPSDICRFFNMRAYGIEHPTPPTANPTLVRSSTLFYWKKAISSFMPLKFSPWDPVHNFGNPTKSQEVNDLIKKVLKHETRGHGRSIGTATWKDPPMDHLF
jgi:hypothetical protein